MSDTNEIMNEETSGSCESCEQYKIGWQRALADYDNLKKDLMREREGMRRAVKEDSAEALIPILDHFDQALKFKPQGLDANVENWLTGMMHVRNQLENVLRELGVEPFGATGDAFNPHMHESVGEREDADAAENSIIEVNLRGWRMGEKIIRPALVVVKK